MGMTISEKILAAHCGKSEVHPGEFIEADVDVALGNDITAPFAIKEFNESGAKKVFDTEKVILVPDHFVPNKDILSAIQVKMLRDFAHSQNLKNFFEVGEVGVEHTLLPEKGLVLPGFLVIGADSHTCTYGALNAFATGVGSTDLAYAMVTGKVWLKVPETIKFVYSGKRNKWVYGKDFILHTIGKISVSGALYKAMEFTGEAVKDLSVYSRFTMSNMAIEAGGKAGIFEFDKKTAEFVKGRTKKKYNTYSADKDARYSETIEIDAGKLKPQVAKPHLPENSVDVDKVGDVKIDQSVIGSCTNGWLEDLQIAASILKGKKVNRNVRTIIFPGTPGIYMQALKTGLIEIFMKAGAAVSTPTCGPCLGGHMGILAPGEKAISTTNRNFVGRMGDVKSEVYLSNPAVAAASAVAGRIIGPDDL
ncbi:MAG: 3-isopropylmalate dehydratase large subunit [bacterium]|nr:3-isopropylmalate dehydratase large subunit [bacterium]